MTEDITNKNQKLPSKQRSQSIRNRLIILLLFLSFVTINYFAVIVYYDNLLSEIEKTAEVAAENKTLTQTILLNAILLKQEQNTYRKALKEALDKHEYNLAILRNGRVLDNGNQIHPAPEILQAEFGQIDFAWIKFRENINTLLQEPIYIDSTVYAAQKLPDSLAKQELNIEKSNVKVFNPKVEDAVEYLMRNAPDILAKDEMLLRAFVNYFDGQQMRRTFWLTIILLLNVILLILAFFYFNRLIVTPIAKISRINTILNEGEFDKKIEYDGNDELGLVANAINALFKNLKNATEFIISIGEGRLEVEYQMSGLDDEHQQNNRLSKALLEMRDKMRFVADQDRQRNWVTEGLAMFADILRKDTDADDFTYRIVANLVKYLNANQGALFAVADNTEEEYLEMLATYAYNKRKYVDKRILKGEGLIGEVFQQGETIYITEVPDNFVNITSGLGDANPRSILMVPLKINNDVFGVLELASFEEFRPYQIEFVEKLSESIATTFASVKTSAQTQRLLADSVQLSEQTRAQEEEMRQNLEELVATQEEVQRKNMLIEEQKQELEKALEEQMLKNEMLRVQEEQSRNNYEMLQKTQRELVAQNQTVLQQKLTLEQQIKELSEDYEKQITSLKDDLLATNKVKDDLEQTLAQQVFKMEALKTAEDELRRKIQELTNQINNK
ncbi:MAG: GAF domain-containing protein [Cytophagales bacterium]|nr:MAG: GAF domain-containing protein [Cytophagales bacterium]